MPDTGKLKDLYFSIMDCSYEPAVYPIEGDLDAIAKPIAEYIKLCEVRERSLERDIKRLRETNKESEKNASYDQRVKGAAHRSFVILRDTLYPNQAREEILINPKPEDRPIPDEVCKTCDKNIDGHCIAHGCSVFGKKAEEVPIKIVAGPGWDLSEEEAEALKAYLADRVSSPRKATFPPWPINPFTLPRLLQRFILSIITPRF